MMKLPETVKQNALSLKERLVDCDICPHRCHVDRTANERGVCRTTDVIPVAHTGLHHGEEPPLSGRRGSGTIFFANCNLRCVFCQNYQISQCMDESDARRPTPEQLAGEMLALQRRGAHNVNLVSPSHVIGQVAESLITARERGLTIPFVYNTNAYDAVDTLRQLDGLIDIYLPDIKYSDDEFGEAYSGVDNYVAASRAAIAEMHRQVGDLELDDRGIAQKGVLVRHLVLPEDVAGSEESLSFLASLSKDMVVSIMSQYSPQFKAHRHPPLGRGITGEEYEQVVDIARELGLKRSYVQGMRSQRLLFPDFDEDRPFENKQ